MAGVIKTVTPWNRGAGHFCVGELNYERSNETISLKASAGALAAGQLLGEQDAATATVTTGDVGTTTGNGTFAATPTADAAAPAGDYTVTIIEPAANGGAFTVAKPDGSLDGHGTIGVAYNGTVNFTLNDGATDFVAGDIKKINVAYAASSGYGAYDPAATNGLQNLTGILWDDRANVAAAQRAVAVKREATVNGNALVGWADFTTNQKAAIVTAAKALGIIILV